MLAKMLNVDTEGPLTAVGTQASMPLTAMCEASGHHTAAPAGEALRSNKGLNLGVMCQQKLPQPYDEAPARFDTLLRARQFPPRLTRPLWCTLQLLATHCQCLGALSAGKADDAYPLMVQTVGTCPDLSHTAAAHPVASPSVQAAPPKGGSVRVSNSPSAPQASSSGSTGSRSRTG